ncbi:MAG: hypothetical protein ACPGVO_21400 [Spirulinaceae cyanobacterium]
MSLQPIHLPDYPEVRIIGNVQIDPTVAIAPGVILHAAPGSQIHLAAGVCLGMGVIIKAYGGSVQLDAGVSLGPGVLIMGPSHLGGNACIGGLSTLWHTTVEPMAVIPAGTVMGDPSRQVDLDAVEPNVVALKSQAAARASQPEPLTPDLWDSPATPAAPEPKAEAIELPLNEPAHSDQNSVASDLNPVVSDPSPEPSNGKPPGQPAYGKVMLNQLLITLFPHEESKRRSP